MLTLGLRPDSAGNVSLTCRSAENRVEGQLTDPANSQYIPQGAARVFRIAAIREHLPANFSLGGVPHL